MRYIAISKVLCVIYAASHFCVSRQILDRDYRQTVEWFAPFFSGGGYCTEALSLAASMGTVQNATFDFRVTHHGDTPSTSFLEGLVTSHFPFFRSENSAY